MHPIRFVPPYRGQPFFHFYPMSYHHPFGNGSYFFGQPPYARGGMQTLFSRFFPASRGAARAAAGGIPNITNPTNLSNMLTNIQKALGVAQQITPMVQQYGPLIRNLPAMLKIYRELKNTDENDTNKTDAVDQRRSANKAEPSDSGEEDSAPEKTPRESKPKLYI